MISGIIILLVIMVGIIVAALWRAREELGLGWLIALGVTLIACVLIPGVRMVYWIMTCAPACMP